MPDACAWQEQAPGGSVIAQLLAPFARRDAEPLLEDAAEMGEVVKAPGEGDLADVPGWLAGSARSRLQRSSRCSDVAAERGRSAAIRSLA